MASKCFKRFDVNFHSLENNNDSSTQSGGSPTSFQDNYVESRPSSISSPPVSYLHTNGTHIPSSQFTGPEWYMDSGVTHHVSQPENLHMHAPYQGNSHLSVGNGNSIPIKHTGSFDLHSLHASMNVKMDRFLHVLVITKNLISVSQFLKDNNDVIEFYSTHCVVKDLTTHKILLGGALKDGFYQLHLDHLQDKNKFSSSCNVAST